MSVELETKSRSEAVPTGLVLFRPGTDPAHRRRRQIFLAVYITMATFLVWPIFPMFSGVRPLILGLPLSLVWVIMTLSVMFVALLWLHRTEGD